MDLSKLVPSVLLDDEDYQVFLTLVAEVNSDIREMISVFPELVDVDNVPEIFLPKLSALIRYHYNYAIDTRIQREIIARIIEVYRNRGTDDEIIMAATYGDDPKWIGSHIFLPDADVNKDRATLTYPIDHAFIHDRSKFSGTDKYLGGDTWRDGVLIITVPHMNEKIAEAVTKVVPAGLRIKFLVKTEISVPCTEDNPYGVIVLGKWKLHFYQTITMDLVPDYMKPHPIRHSHPEYGKLSTNNRFSGGKGTDIFIYIPWNNIHPRDDSYNAVVEGDSLFYYARNDTLEQCTVDIIDYSS